MSTRGIQGSRFTAKPIKLQKSKKTQFKGLKKGKRDGCDQSGRDGLPFAVGGADHRDIDKVQNVSRDPEPCSIIHQGRDFWPFLPVLFFSAEDKFVPM
jgi:hypothetical protein